MGQIDRKATYIRFDRQQNVPAIILEVDEGDQVVAGVVQIALEHP